MAEKKLQLKIATPEKLVYEAAVDSVSIPAAEGEITVLPGHAPVVVRLLSGDIVARSLDEETPFVVVGGFAEVNQESVTILTNFAEDVLAAEGAIQSARARADELEKMKGRQDVDFGHFASELERSLTRVRIADKWKRKKYK